MVSIGFIWNWYTYSYTLYPNFKRNLHEHVELRTLPTFLWSCILFEKLNYRHKSLLPSGAIETLFIHGRKTYNFFSASFVTVAAFNVIAEQSETQNTYILHFHENARRRACFLDSIIAFSRTLDKLSFMRNLLSTDITLPCLVSQRLAFNEVWYNRRVFFVYRTLCRQWQKVGDVWILNNKFTRTRPLS